MYNSTVEGFLPVHYFIIEGLQIFVSVQDAEWRDDSPFTAVDALLEGGGAAK